MSTATDYIKAALRRITSYQSGETIATPDINDCLETFNDMLDSWSTGENHVFGVNENIVQWSSGQNQYSIGNPICTDVGSPPFAAFLSIGSNLIAATPPADLKIGAVLISQQGLFPSGTTVVAFDPISVTMSTSATNTGNDSITYTVPGDFAFERPLIITSGFTRFSQLDFTLDIAESEDEYNAILYKAQPGPWPTVAWYNNTYPYGTLKVYQTPGNSSELHLFTQGLLRNLTANSVVVMPQGYARAVKWCLARELWCEYVSPGTVPVYLEKIANESLDMIKALNAKPAQRSTYDIALAGNRRADGGWIFSGGYR